MSCFLWRLTRTKICGSVWDEWLPAIVSKNCSHQIHRILRIRRVVKTAREGKRFCCWRNALVVFFNVFYLCFCCLSLFTWPLALTINCIKKTLILTNLPIFQYYYPRLPLLCSVRMLSHIQCQQNGVKYIWLSIREIDKLILKIYYNKRFHRWSHGVIKQEISLVLKIFWQIHWT